MSRKWYGVTFLAVVLYCALLVAHALTRRPWTDEAMFADPAFTLISKGYLGCPVEEFAYAWPNLARHVYMPFPLNLVVLAGWFKIVGFGLIQQRVLSMLWTGILLFSIYRLIGVLLQDARTALWCTVLVALDYQIMVAGSFGRYDPMVAALGFCGYLLYLSLREKHLHLALILANTAVMLAGTTHPNGLLYFFGLSVLVLYHDRRRLGWRQVALSAVPYVAGGLVWGAYVMQDPRTAIAQLSSSSWNRVSILHPWLALKREILLRHGPGFGLIGPHSAGTRGPVQLKAVPLLAYVSGVIGCCAVPALRRHPGCRTLLLLTMVHLLYLTFFEGIKFAFYLEHLNPLYAVMLGIFTAWLWRSGRAPKLAVASAMALVLAIEVGGIVMRVRINTYGEHYAPALAFVKRHASPKDLVVGSPDFGFGYGFESNFRDDPLVGFNSGVVPEFIVWDADIYQDEFDKNALTKPDAHRYIVAMLRQYDSVFHNDGYTIYRRRADAGPPPPGEPFGK